MKGRAHQGRRNNTNNSSYNSNLKSEHYHSFPRNTSDSNSISDGASDSNSGVPAYPDIYTQRTQTTTNTDDRSFAHHRNLDFPIDKAAVSPDSRNHSRVPTHSRNLSSASATSISPAPHIPYSLFENWPVSPFTKYSFPAERPFKEKQHQRQHLHRRNSSFDHAFELSSPFPPFPYHLKSPERRKLTHPLLRNTASSEDRDIPINNTFPKSALRSPDRPKRSREKNVSFSFFDIPSIYSEPQSRSPFENIRQVSPSRKSYNHHMMQESSRHPLKKEDKSEHVISSGANGVEVALKSDTEKSGPYSMLVRAENSIDKRKDSGVSNKNDTPPREKTSEKGKKVTVITPQEGQNHGHSRSPSYNTVDFHAELPSVPDSPYSPFPGHHAGYAYSSSHPPSFQGFPSPTKLKSPKRESQSEDYLSHYPPYSPHYGFHYPGLSSYEDSYREMSPGKRQRLSTDVMESDQYISKDDHFPEMEHYSQNPYRYLNRPGGRNFAYTESFDSESAGFDRSLLKHPGAAPPVSKASSYPPPPSSPSRYSAVPESSSNSYPGAHPRSQESAGDLAQVLGLNPYRGNALPPPRFPYDYHDGYYPEQLRSRHLEMPTSAHPRLLHPSYYYHDLQQPHDEVHPLLKDYDPERDNQREASQRQGKEKRRSEKQSSPDRSTKTDGESVATTPSLKSRNSKSTSPSKRKPSTAAKAAIAAGMTQPPAASEIDFDIHNPPLEPVTPPSKEAVCNLASNVNNDDVLCGRGGGTNTQIGNRKFRSLVQEFQPTYLLCRRKEKPLIARTIVLIIRNRGGRFLKKDESNGMLFEVGDEKAEAKTSQALREGLDVRASKSTTLMGRKQKRAAEKKKQKQAAGSTSSHSGSKAAPQTEDLPMSESPIRSQRDPPPQHEYSQYPPPPYFYGYGGQYPPYTYGYDHNSAYSTPSRKRQRVPPTEAMYYPPATPYGHNKGYPPYPYPAEYHYQNYAQPTLSHSDAGEESMWENDFNPPRGLTKKEDVRLKGEQ